MFKIGDRVLIVAGYLKGYSGICDSDADHSSKILVTNLYIISNFVRSIHLNGFWEVDKKHCVPFSEAAKILFLQKG